MTADNILYELFQTGQITFEEFLKAQKPPSKVIDEIKKAMKEYETDRK